MIVDKKKLERYTKTELIDRVFKNILSSQEAKKDSDSIIRKLEEKIKRLDRELKELRANSVEKLTEKEMLEEVLKLKATGKGSMRIYEILNDSRGLDVSLLEVRSICDNIDDLSEETKSFYNNQKKLYFDNLEFNKGNTLMGDMLTLEGMIDSARRVLETLDTNMDEEDFDYDRYRKQQDQISKLIKDKNNLLKSITGKGDEDDESEDFDIGYVEETEEELDLEIIED